MNDIYRPPSAELLGEGNLKEFQRFSTWYVVGLTIITLTFYLPYWLYTRTSILNELSENKISIIFTRFTVSFYVLTFVIVIYMEFYDLP